MTNWLKIMLQIMLLYKEGRLTQYGFEAIVLPTNPKWKGKKAYKKKLVKDSNKLSF